MIGVFGGTFDPVHFGHLRPLLEVKQALDLDEVHLIPCCMPPHRDEPIATPKQRLAMLRLAVKDVPGFVVDERELQRGGVSYMVDTLQSLRDEVGETPLCLILGQDVFARLDTWHQWSRLIELAHIVAIHRPGSELPTNGPVVDLLEECLADDVGALRQQPAGLIVHQTVTQLDISATTIRDDIRAGRDISFLMPEAVQQYIEEQGLYC